MRSVYLGVGERRVGWLGARIENIFLLEMKVE